MACKVRLSPRPRKYRPWPCYRPNFRPSRDLKGETVIIKAAKSFRLDNEREVLKRFQTRTPFLRPLIDEIQEPANPPALVLRHLDHDLLQTIASRRPTRPEIKQVARSVINALQVLHEEHYVHTGSPPRS